MPLLSLSIWMCNQKSEKWINRIINHSNTCNNIVLLHLFVFWINVCFVENASPLHLLSIIALIILTICDDVIAFNSVCVNYVFFFSFFLRAVFAVFAIKYLTLFA